MTIINTKTSNWEITFQADKLRELSLSQQEQAKTFFELIGDALFVFNMLEDEAVRTTLELNYTFVLSDLTQLVQNAVMSALQQQLWVTPLEGDLAYDKLFGANLLNEIKKLALQEQGFENQLPEELFLSDAEDGSVLFHKFFTAFDEIVEGEENQPSFEDDDEDEEDDEEEEDDFTEH